MNNIERIIKILEKYLKEYRYPTLSRSSKEKNPFKTLIACLLSLRTKDKNTESVSEKLFKIFGKIYLDLYNNHFKIEKFI